LRTETGVRYNANVQTDWVDIVDQWVSQLEECGKKTGMETSKQAETDGKIVPILRGKDLVVDLVVDLGLAVDRYDGTRPSYSLLLSRSHTPRPSAGDGGGLGFVDGFLMDHIRGFIVETHQLLGEQDTKKVARLIKRFLAHV
jgi:hypothetical protein